MNSYSIRSYRIYHLSLVKRLRCNLAWCGAFALGVFMVIATIAAAVALFGLGTWCLFGLKYVRTGQLQMSDWTAWIMANLWWLVSLGIWSLLLFSKKIRSII